MDNSKGDKIHTEKQNKIKLVIWDLDNTIWDGTLLENPDVKLYDGIITILDTLDKRGILQSVASKNEYDHAMEKMKSFGIDHYFIYPKIGWNAKSASVAEITKSVNIGLNTVAFVDDQLFERDEVKYSLPEVLCINADNREHILDYDVMNPLFITEDSKNRRLMYMSDIKRREEEEAFEGAKESYLETLQMKLTIGSVKEKDLQRAEELTVRTHQLNTTGYTYSYDELKELSKSPDYLMLAAELTDKHGDYGKIGLTLIKIDGEIWTIKLFLMSCRTMSTGAGSVFLNYIIRLAHQRKVKLQAEFLSNDRNRVMYITYKFAGFERSYCNHDMEILLNNYQMIQSVPDYMELNILD